MKRKKHQWARDPSEIPDPEAKSNSGKCQKQKSADPMPNYDATKAMKKI